MYLTTHSLILTVLNMGIVYFSKKPDSSISLINMHLLTTLVMIFGLYITHGIKRIEADIIDLTPIGLDFKYSTIVTGTDLLIVDFFFHTLPFILTWSILGKPRYSLEAYITTMLLLSIYIMMVDTKKVYLFKNSYHKKNYKKLILVSFVTYIFLYSIF
jgi:hypothetical protein